MKNKKTIKQNSYIKHYTNKLLLILATFFILFGVANAGTLSDSTGVLTYDSVNVCMADGSIFQEKINNKYYVEPNNFDDVQVKIDLAYNNITNQYQTREVRIPNGDYFLTSQIDLKEGVNMVCDEGVYFWYNSYSVNNMVNISPKTTIRNCNFINSWGNYNANMLYIEASGISQQQRIKIDNVRLDNVINNNGTGLLVQTPDSGGSLAYARFNDLYIRGFENSIYLRAVDTNTSKYSFINGNWFENIQLHSYVNGFRFEANGGEVYGNTISEYQAQTSEVSKNLFLFEGDNLIRSNTITGYTWDALLSSGANESFLVVNSTCAKCYGNSFMTTYLDKQFIVENPNNPNFYYDRNLGELKNFQLEFTNKLSYENLSSYIRFNNLNDLINDLSLTNTGGVSFINHHTGTSASFSGSNYLRLDESTLFASNNSQTISLSFKLNDKNTGTTQYVLSHPYTSGTYGNRVYLTESNGALYFRLGSQSSQVIIPSDELHIDKWYNIQAVKDNINNRVLVYIDGQLESNTSSNWEVDYSPTYTYFGALGASGSYLNGEIDDFMIFDRELSLNEIKSLNSQSSEIVPLDKLLIDNGGTSNFNSNLNLNSNNLTTGKIFNSLGLRFTGSGSNKNLESSSTMYINAGYDNSGNEYLLLQSNGNTGIQIKYDGTTKVNSLTGTYSGGSAYVCVYDDGYLYASETACP